MTKLRKSTLNCGDRRKEPVGKRVLLESDMVLLVMTATVEHLQGSMELIRFLFRTAIRGPIKVVCNRYKLKKGLESDEILAVLPIPLKWQWLPEERPS